MQNNRLPKNSASISPSAWAGIPYMAPSGVHAPAQPSAQEMIYRLAHEKAQQAVRIPRIHRMLFSVWN